MPEGLVCMYVCLNDIILSPTWPHRYCVGEGMADGTKKTALSLARVNSQRENILWSSS